MPKNSLEYEQLDRERSIMRELRHDATEPSGNDVYLDALSVALFDRLTTDVGYYEWYMQNVHRRAEKGPFSGTHALDMTKKLIQLPAVIERENFPLGFQEPDAWKEYIDLPYTESDAKSAFESYMFMWTLATNVWQRIVGQMCIGATLQTDAYREGYRYLDMGCSGNLGAAYMHAYHNKDISDEVLQRSKPEVIAKDSHALLVESLLRVVPRFEHLHGIDPMAVSDEMYEWWRLACRNPGELASQRLRRETMLLQHYRDTVPEIKFTQDAWHMPRYDDIPTILSTNPRYATRSDGLAKEEKFHQIGNNFVTYLLDKTGLVQLIENEEYRLEDDGIISITGHITIDHSESGHPANQIKHLTHWRRRKMPVQTVIKRKGSDHFELFVEWSDGRMRAMRPHGKLLHIMKSVA